MTSTPPPPRSRRNHPSLSHLHLAPLSTANPDHARNDENSASGSRTPPWKQSYIAGKSAPTTPSILSRSPSRTRLRNLANSKSYTNFAFTDDLDSGILKRSKSNKSNTKKKASTPHPRDGRSDWLFRAGAAISDETRSSKGQAWLVNRASSTSLVRLGHESDESEDDDVVDAPRILSPDTDRRQFSRSQRGSTHPSRNVSRTDLATMTPGMFSTRVASRGSRVSLYSAEDVDDYFGTRRDRPKAAAAPGPDFVDGAEDDEEGVQNESDEDSPEQQAADEAEIGRLARERRGVLDQILSWALFPDEDAPDVESGEEDDDSAVRDAAQKAALGHLRNARVAEGTAPVAPEGLSKASKADQEGVSGWTDAAWLLSVASKVIF